MRTILTSVAVLLCAAIIGGAAQAGYTLFDTAKDAGYIVRGEFVGLERTDRGDRLTFRCDKVLNGEVEVGQEVTIEPIDKAYNDAALGREAIIGFNLRDGKFYSTWLRRSIYTELDDVAGNGLDINEAAITALLEINAPHMEAIRNNQPLPASLFEAWRVELIRQAGQSGSWAARDAAKVLFEHSLLKGTLSAEQMREIGGLVPKSAPGTIERAYMLSLVRTHLDVHPDLNTQFEMLMEETSEACVGKLANLISVKDRAAVLSRLDLIVEDKNSTSQQRVNALQVLEGLRDTDGLSTVHGVLSSEVANGESFDKDVVRRALLALRTTPHDSSVTPLEDFIRSDIGKNSRELSERALIAYSVIDNDTTNGKLIHMYLNAPNPAQKQFLRKLLPVNKETRLLVQIFNED